MSDCGGFCPAFSRQGRAGADPAAKRAGAVGKKGERKNAWISGTLTVYRRCPIIVTGLQHLSKTWTIAAKNIRVEKRLFHAIDRDCCQRKILSILPILFQAVTMPSQPTTRGIFLFPTNSIGKIFNS
jgi:hypothetical protein